MGFDKVLSIKNKFFPILILINRGVFFLFLMCLLVFFLYAIGTVQGFMDSTQLLLLRLESILDVSLAAGAFGVMVQDMVRFFRYRKFHPQPGKRIRHLLGALGFLVLGIAGVLSALAVLFVITVSGGNTL